MGADKKRVCTITVGDFMKKIYSIILLITFLVGTLQPILPMIEYQLFEGNIIELLGADNVCHAQDSYEMIQCMNGVDCPIDKNDDQQLLDTDFYPLALEITAVPDPRVFLIGAKIYLPTAENVIGPALTSLPPPPRIS